jgi:hypothetical protein
MTTMMMTIITDGRFAAAALCPAARNSVRYQAGGEQVVNKQAVALD